MRTTTFSAFALALLLGSTGALAEPPRPAHPPLAQALQGDARALYDSARELFKAGEYASAHAKFQRARELSSDPRLYWNMAACERKVKHNASVLRLLEAYLREGEGWLSEEEQREASRAAAAVRAFVAATSVKTTPEDGVEVFVDDIRVATTPIAKPLWVDMGEHRVRFSKEGFRTLERKEDVPAGSELSWSITLEPASASERAPQPVPPPPPSRPAPQERAAPSRVGPLVLGGTGLALAVGGGALVFLTTREFSSLRDECGSSCDRTRWEKYRTTQLVGDVLLVAGATALAAGVVWWVALPSKASEERRAWLAPAPRGFTAGLAF